MHPELLSYMEGLVQPSWERAHRRRVTDRVRAARAAIAGRLHGARGRPVTAMPASRRAAEVPLSRAA